jgi:hypothetical protein
MRLWAPLRDTTLTAAPLPRAILPLASLCGAILMDAAPEALQEQSTPREPGGLTTIAPDRWVPDSLRGRPAVLAGHSW